MIEQDVVNEKMHEEQPIDLPNLPSRYARRAYNIGNDDSYMVHRRVGLLHLQRLQRILRVTNEPNGNLSQPSRTTDDVSCGYLSNERPSRQSWNWPSKTIDERLSEHSRPKPKSGSGSVLTASIRRNDLEYEVFDECSSTECWRLPNVREYLHRGPPIYMDHTEIGNHRWARYEKAAEDILNDPETRPWLDGPLDQDWTDKLLQQKDWREHDQRRVDNLSWKTERRGS